jgi:hypothetical protein
MFWFKSCPRCGGDLYRSDIDEDGPLVSCLQCGRVFPEVALAVLGVIPAPQPMPLAMAAGDEW